MKFLTETETQIRFVFLTLLVPFAYIKNDCETIAISILIIRALNGLKLNGKQHEIWSHLDLPNVLSFP